MMKKLFFVVLLSLIFPFLTEAIRLPEILSDNMILQENQKIYIGIINASWGDTEIEPWISGKSFDMLPDE